jgi:hypothetical protein
MISLQNGKIPPDNLTAERLSGRRCMRAKIGLSKKDVVKGKSEEILVSLNSILFWSPCDEHLLV